MPLKSPVLLFISFFVCSLQAQIELPNFRQVGPKEGLPEGHVHAIICDSKGSIWIASYEGLYQYTGSQCRPVYSQGKEDTASLSSQRVFSLLEDHQHRIWVGTSVGLNCMDRQTGKFRRYQNQVGKPIILPDNYIVRIFEDPKKRIWISTKKGPAILDEQTGKFKLVAKSDSFGFIAYTTFESQGKTWFAGNGGVYFYDETKNTLIRTIFTDVIERGKKLPTITSARDNKDNAWIGTYNGLFKINTEGRTIAHSGFPDKILDKVRINALLFKDNHLWIGSSIGLIDWDLNSNQYKHYHYITNNPMGLTTSFIQSLTMDDNGNIWVGTSLNAASFQIQNKPIAFYTLDPELPFNDGGNHATRLFEDHLGNIWTWNGKGVQKSEGLGKPMQVVKGTPYPYFLEHFLEVEYKDKPTLLMSYSSPGKGLFTYNRQRQEIERFPLNAKLDKMSLYRVIADKNNKNKLWIGTYEGICIYDLVSKDTSWIRFAGKKTQLRSFHQLDDGKWILMSPLGYSFYDDNSKTQEVHLYDPDAKNMFHSGLIRDIRMGQNGSLWIATETGLSYYDAKTKQYSNYTTSNGLKGGNIIYAMYSDHYGTCWFVTNSYLINHDPETGKFRYFNSSNGVFTTFNRYSFCLLRNGNVLFGGINGFISFNPDKMKPNTVKPRLLLTNFQVRNKARHFGLLPENITEVKVGYQENALTFEFVALEYASPEKNEYAYQMQGFDTGWIYSGNERRATYTNLSPGTYFFLVKCSNSEGIWSDEILKVKVIITPLYYQTWWFRALILLTIGAVVWLFVRNRNQKRLLEQQKEIAEMNSKYKSKFLTNMSHEIRTPMNAIIGLNRLLLETPLNEKQKKYAGAVQQSSENLLWIVNDILDQAKIESGKYTIVSKPFQLDVILKQIHNLLLIKAEEKNLEFKFEISNNAPLKLMGDPVRLYQILTNLVANAIKFTPKGQVSLHVESTNSNGDQAKIRFLVKDTGVGIPGDKIHEIFESFNQLDHEDAGHAGTGLGLTIARELILQMGGEIVVNSEINKGTTFIVTLPFQIDTSSGISVASTATQKKSSKALRILLVDDTRFNILLAQELLAEQFPKTVTDTAENGKIALEKIQENAYDIVLMDVKMPVMDGIEATRIIRNSTDEKIKNMPILGLTANAIPEQLEECYNAGMNDYLTKPVNASELFTKIDQLTN